jgi:hypothetical protein
VQQSMHIKQRVITLTRVDGAEFDALRTQRLIAALSPAPQPPLACAARVGHQQMAITLLIVQWEYLKAERSEQMIQWQAKCVSVQCQLCTGLVTQISCRLQPLLQRKI